MATSTVSRLPAEWEPHSATVVAWPGRPSVWDRHLDAGREETRKLVCAVADAEPVVVAVRPSEGALVQTTFEDRDNVTVLRVPLDDCWARDISPFFVLGAGSAPLAVDFGFNAWGGKFRPHDADAAFGAAISRHLGLERVQVDLVLEGGSLTTDGRGTAIIVESTVLSSDRNPRTSREAVEAVLLAELGITTVIWLAHGLLGDTDTDGHTDNVAVFCGEGRVLAQVAGRGSPDRARLDSNRDRLRRARDAQGRQLEIVEVPWLPVSRLDGSRPCSYVNSFPVAGAVIVPTVGDPSEDLALQLVSDAFGGLEPVAVESSALGFGGGGPHCMTMQVPDSRNHQPEGDRR